MIAFQYLLGFPTPIIELFLGGVALFLVSAIYFGLNFTGLDEVDLDRDEERHDETQGTESEGMQP